jgi:hypothetical protein
MVGHVMLSNMKAVYLSSFVQVLQTKLETEIGHNEIYLGLVQYNGESVMNWGRRSEPLFAEGALKIWVVP